MKVIKRLTLLWLFLLGGFACTKTTTVKVPLIEEDVDLASYVRINFNFSLFAHALQRTGLDSVIKDTTPHTLLVPDNTAFAQLGILTNDDLDKMALDSLKRWMGMHILAINAAVADIPRAINRSYFSINNMELHVTHNTNELRVNGVRIVKPDLKASNGYIHVLERPLRLPWPSIKYFLTHDSSYSILAAGLQRFNLLDQLDSAGPFTLIAPFNDAFIGEGLPLDSVNRMDPQQFKAFLFSAGTIPRTRIYTADMTDAEFQPPGGLAVIGPDYLTSLYYSDGGANSLFYVYDPMRSGLNPNWFYNTAFLGPSYVASFQIPGGGGITGVGPQTLSSTVNLDCDNGVVHGVNDILVWPDSARIH